MTTDPSTPAADGPGPTDRDAVIERWWADLTAALGLDEPGVSAHDVLDLAAVAAHRVVRPAAPLTTFLVGYAAGLAGGGPDAVATAREEAEALARIHAEDGTTEHGA